MKVKKNIFIKEYVKAIEENRAAVFAGAGLSKPAGYVDWKGLLRDIAEEIELDIDKESDLIAVAQYYINANGNDRGQINQKLIEEFSKTADVTENHEILSNLPIRYYWTTNYDRMIESSLEQKNKIVDVKVKPDNLTFSIPRSDAIIYKMHGDIGSPQEAVLSKDDYELYSLEKELFTIALKGDLVSKTFLFIGFSFEDPNLEYILSRVRILVGNNKRTHYCFMKNVSESNYKIHDDYIYAKVQQEHRINDLGRYGIKVVLVDEYEEITDILETINNKFKRKNVFISGSATSYEGWGEDRILSFTSRLSKAIIKNNNNIVSGFGLGLGRNIITGALEELYTSPKTPNNIVEERLKLRPFPTNKELFTQYRNEMLNQVGVSVFIFGNKIDEKGTVINANGMYEEFEIAVKKNIIPIPVGVTGFMAEEIYDEVLKNFQTYIKCDNEEIKNLYIKLNNKTLTDEEVIDTVIKIINKFMEG